MHFPLSDRTFGLNWDIQEYEGILVDESGGLEEEEFKGPGSAVDDSARCSDCSGDQYVLSEFLFLVK